MWQNILAVLIRQPLITSQVFFSANINSLRELWVCRIVIFAESQYSAEHSALPNNEENMFNQASGLLWVTI